ncbi:dihydrofolate reductase family protein [Micromonospora endolithica]|uniref:Dihydrofolate reductase n=1 Tax=Micromonospora endolithica TaxID=230091 RepID=A0A3A9ZNV6_9ACTN|nr:dihydrofolate reductase family protein [Micromonospora endolithica]RKN49177.1 dihydrofolate reductase [Micromonospora endolithica]TWJ23344.1 dihydrofolate reductase [Micromonospora endolithica]
MAKVVVQMNVSVDGFFEGPDGDIGWHQVDNELHGHFNDELRQMAEFHEGRRTYELMESFWPTADQDPEADAPMAEFAGIWRDTPKVVYSRTLATVGPNATLVREVDPEEIRRVRTRPGGDIAVGGAELAAAFARLDLVDEYWIYVHPVLVGAGRRMFPADGDRHPMRLAGTRTFGNGVVLLRHERARD